MELPTHPDAYKNAGLSLNGYNYGFLDIEHWPTSAIWSPGSTEADRHKYWGYLQTVFQNIKDCAPNVRLGFFGTVGCPTSTWTVDLGFSIQYQEAWDKVWGPAATGLPDQVDYLAPGFYWVGQPMAEMERRLKNEVAISRGYQNRPIYPFIWHRRQDVFDGGDTSDASLIPMTEWQAIIDMCLLWADGFCYWTHSFETITPAAQLRLDAVQTAANNL